MATTDPTGRGPTEDPVPDGPGYTDGADYAHLARARWRMAMTLTGVIMFVYFGFIALVGYAKDAMGDEVVNGLSLGMLLGIITILTVFVVTLVYARWANAHDVTVDRHHAEGR